MKKIIYLLTIIGLLTAFSQVSVSGQTSPAPSPKATKNDLRIVDFSLLVENEDGKQIKLSLADLAKLKLQTVKTRDHGKEAIFEGYALVEILKAAGIEFGDTLRGKRLASYLVVEAADQYQVVFALPELDPAFTDQIILLADKRDGQPLSKNEGPLRLIVPDEKKAGRWVRQVTVMKILRAPVANY